MPYRRVLGIAYSERTPTRDQRGCFVARPKANLTTGGEFDRIVEVMCKHHRVSACKPYITSVEVVVVLGRARNIARLGQGGGGVLRSLTWMIEGLFNGISGIAVETDELLLVVGLLHSKKRTVVCAGKVRQSRS